MYIIYHRSSYPFSMMLNGWIPGIFCIHISLSFCQLPRCTMLHRACACLRYHDCKHYCSTKACKKKTGVAVQTLCRHAEPLFALQ